MSTSYTNLERNIMNEIGVQPLSFDANQDISTYATFNFLYVSSITLIIAAAAVMYIIAGGWRIEASERGIRKSNETFKRVTLGLIGVLSLFVILYTVNKDLLRGDVGLNALKASVQGGTGGAVPTPGATQPVQTNGTEQANRDALQAANISVNKSPCTATQMTETEPSCTNVANLDPAVISMLIQLKDTCPGSSITVTGGTEPGHKNHFAGRAVDVRIGNDELDSCIRKFPASSNLGFCNFTYSRMGFIFCDEKTTDKNGNRTGDPHWHIYK